jgi:hypothetical protein
MENCGLLSALGATDGRNLSGPARSVTRGPALRSGAGLYDGKRYGCSRVRSVRSFRARALQGGTVLPCVCALLYDASAAPVYFW